MKRLRYTKVNVIGAQNTGKTTLINALAEDKDIKASGLNIMTGMLRRMASEGKINISVDGDPDSQRLMFSYYSELLEQGNNFISDRCVVDVIAYTSEMCDMEEGARKMKFSMEEQYDV
jgi:GTPase SAR1 family protein